MAQTSHCIPPELVENIIDFNFNDIATLVACSQVARAWVPATRCHLFGSINLKTARRILAFADILRSSACIARHIRDVQSPVWLSKTAPRDALSRILRQLTAIESISCAGQQLQPVWYEVLGQLPSVKYLKLRTTWCDLDALNGLLCALPALTDLFLETRMLSGVGDITAHSSRLVGLPCLERVVVFNESGLPNDFQSILLKQDLPHLESIEAQFGSEEDVALFSRFIDRGGYRNVKDLHMEFVYGCPEGRTHDADSCRVLGECVRKCNLRSLGLKYDSADNAFQHVWEVAKEALTLTDSSNFPMCMYT